MTPRKIEFYRHDLGEAEIASLRETFASPFLTLGPRVGVFEKKLGAELGVPHVVGVTSCTVGMHLVVNALGIGPGDEIITTPMTYISTPNAALYVGATPVFADIDPKTGLIDPDDVARKITPRTKAILVVHLYGQMCHMRALSAIAQKHGIKLLEDTAHGFEAERDGYRPGQLSDAAIFSFYATKTITAGDGGAIATRHAELDAKLRRSRNHGTSKDAVSRYGGSYQHWDMVELGFKGAMTDVDAALLLPQLERAHQNRAKREAVVERYEARLRGKAGIELCERTGRSAHHLFTVRVARGDRDRVIARLNEQGVPCAINYRAVHTLTYYRERFAVPESALPHATEFGDRTISLPLWPGLPHDDVDYVCDALVSAVSA